MFMFSSPRLVVLSFIPFTCFWRMNQTSSFSCLDCDSFHRQLIPGMLYDSEQITKPHWALVSTFVNFPTISSVSLSSPHLSPFSISLFSLLSHSSVSISVSSSVLLFLTLSLYSFATVSLLCLCLSLFVCVPLPSPHFLAAAADQLPYYPGEVLVSQWVLT